MDTLGSRREIIHKKEQLNVELRMALYLYDNTKYILTAITAIAETGIPVILEANIPDALLGLAICDKLLEFQTQMPPKLSGKPTDWPTYKASGAKTIKKFEQNSIHVLVQTINLSIQISAKPQIYMNQPLKTVCSANFQHASIGAAVRKAIYATQILQKAGAF